MTLPKGGAPPTKKDAAASAATEAAGSDENQKQHQQDTTSDADRLVEMALAVSRDGALWHYLPKQPGWYRRIGSELLGVVLAKRDLTSVQRHRLEFVYLLGSSIREGAEIGLAYPPATHGSVDEARSALRDALEHIHAKAAAWRVAITPMAA